MLILYSALLDFINAARNLKSNFKGPPSMQCIWCLVYSVSFIRLRLDEVSWDDHLMYDGGSGLGGRGTGCHLVNHNVISGFIISRWLLFRHWCRADQSAKLSNWRWQSDRCLIRLNILKWSPQKSMTCSTYFSHFTLRSCDNINSWHSGIPNKSSEIA